jgi:hypothetical protein
MAFNWKGLVRFAVRLLPGVSDHHFRWTPRRIGILLAFFLLYPLHQAFVWIGLWLDELLFHAYRGVEVREPVFIVGNPRSGTTFLHRLIAQDRTRYSTMEMWEILFAPAVVTRRTVRTFARLDRVLGGPIHRIIAAEERRWHEENAMHRVSLRAPEEDDYLLLHIWSALTAGLSAGLLEEARPYTYFDTELPPGDRRRIMDFYRRCVQRHLYAHRAAGRRYLAKNPALSPKLVSVLERFPDAKIICLVRSPFEMVPSYVSMMDFSWRVTGNPAKDDALSDFIVDMAQHWYRHPLEVLDALPAEQAAILRYDDLVADPGQAVTAIYEQFGFEISPAFAQTLHAETQRAKRYHSRHKYSLQEAGLDPEQIRSEFGDILARFDFGDQMLAPDVDKPIKKRRPTSERPSVDRGRRQRKKPAFDPEKS